jgi:hypothetical protein
MPRINKASESKEIQYDDVREANKQKSEYGAVVTPYYREQAAATIQSAFRGNRKLKAAKKWGQEVAHTSKAARRQRYWASRDERYQLKQMNRLKEPSDITANDAFNTKLVQAIKNNQYHLIDYTYKDFTPRLFAALRLGLITMNQLLSVKLMYESLICFNKGKMPGDPIERFRRYKISDPSGPFQPSIDITHWGETETELLQSELQKPEADEALHYYTINVPRHQAIGFFYFSINIGTRRPQFINLFSSYIDKLHLGTEEKTKVLALLELYTNSVSNEGKEELKQFILTHEPKLNNFLRYKYDFISPQNENNLGLTYAEFSREQASTQFLASLYYLNCQIPSVCIPQDDHPEKEQALLSFVLPTIDTLNTLQKIAHGEEATLPVAVVGPVTPRMIRAYDEIPASTLKGRTFTSSEVLLDTLYPTAGTLKAPSRPVESTYPGVDRTRKPHNYKCHDFMLSWHDVFHAWRSGSNYKEWLRYLRKLHDEKAGFFQGVDAMSHVIWDLSDLDLSVGQLFKDKPDKLERQIICFFRTLTEAGFDFTKPKDDNYLLIYSLFQSPECWGEPFGINPQALADYHLPWIDSPVQKEFTTFLEQANNMKSYMKDHPNASVVEVILRDLLKPEEEIDSALLDALRFKFKKIFYWSRNTGLYFKKEFREELKKMGVKPNVRENSPELIRTVLKNIVPQINLELAGFKWPDEIKQEIQHIKDYFKQNALMGHLVKQFEVDKEKQCVVLKTTKQSISDIPPKEFLNLYLKQLDDKTLNQVLAYGLKKNPDNELADSTNPIKLFQFLEENIISRLDFRNLNQLVYGDESSLKLLECFPPEKNQNAAFIPMIRSMMGVDARLSYIKKYFDLNPAILQSLNDPQKKYIYGLVKEFFKGDAPHIRIGDGRNGNKDAPKNVPITKAEHLKKAMNSFQIATQDKIPIQINDSQFKYQLVYERYQALFDKILENDLDPTSKKSFYTRKFGVNLFHSNAQTKSLTNTQLMHLRYLKDLFIDEVKSLINESTTDTQLISYIKDNINNKEHFINFNRTRYSFFMKDSTTSNRILMTELDKNHHIS